MFSYALAYSIAAPICGYLADRFNRRTLLLFSLVALCVDAAAIAFAPNLSVAIILRVFGGVASAIIIPNAFALVSELTPKQAHAKSMGLVMLGMTFGIALGPAIAGTLTELSSWRAPFVVVALGCISAFVFVKRCIPSNYKAVELRASTNADFKRDWYRKASVLRPLLAKGIWNGTGVAAFLLVGQTLQESYDLGVAYAGIVITVFGLGLGTGNLLVPFFQKILPNEESILSLLSITLLISVVLFFASLSSVYFSLLMLFFWGAGLGAAAPCSTSILVARSGQSKGEVLSFAETLNNIVILIVFPVAAYFLEQQNYVLLSFLFGMLLVTSATLCFIDARAVSTETNT